ncbi:MAG: YCF48-related protein, partial [Candidatus Thorarchaeota archaeon]
MKKIYAILFISLLFQFNTTAQWEQQTAPEFILTDDFYSIAKVDNNIFCAVGQNGIIIKSTDGGNTWLPRASNTHEDLNNVFFVDENNGWAVGNNGALIKTGNGGENWYSVSTGINDDLRSIFFVNSNVGWFCGTGGIIYKTINGNSWNPQVSGTTMSLNSIYFIDSNTGWACGNGGEILGTTDGGVNWNKQNSYTNYSLSSVYFVNSNVGWICGILNSGLYGKILTTKNGGANWSTQFNTQTNECLYSIKFFDEDNGTTVGINGTIYITTNGGTNWIKKNSGVRKSIRGCLYNDLNNEIAVGYEGTVLKSTNSGNDWNVITLEQDYNLNSVCFINRNLGWAAGSYGIIIHTTDGGQNWSVQNSSSNFNIKKIKFIDPLHGWCLNDYSFLRTINGGERWDFIDLKTNIENYHDYLHTNRDLCFIDSEIGWIESEDVAEGGYVIHTTDGGINWKSANSPHMSGGFRSEIIFLDKYIGFMFFGNATEGEDLYRTTNGGQNWLMHFPLYPNGGKINILDMYFINNNVGYISMQEWSGFPSLAKTIDGGELWGKKLFRSGYDEYRYERIFFIDEFSGWVLGNNNDYHDSNLRYFIYNTDDGGNTWNHSLENFTTPLNDISFADRFNGWAVGGETILKYGFSPSIDESNWSNSISVENNLVSKTIIFGQSPNATDGIDTDLGEEELPPPPPPGNLDLRFNLPTNVSSAKDFRNNSENKIIWTLNFQPDALGYPLTFIWNRYSLPDGSFRLRDAVTGNIINIDMKEYSSYKLSNSGISTLIIEYSKESCTNIAINKGWNLMSIPSQQSQMVVGPLFPSASSSAFVFNSNGTTYNEY